MFPLSQLTPTTVERSAQFRNKENKIILCLSCMRSPLDERRRWPITPSAPTSYGCAARTPRDRRDSIVEAVSLPQGRPMRYFRWIYFPCARRLLFFLWPCGCLRKGKANREGPSARGRSWRRTLVPPHWSILLSRGFFFFFDFYCFILFPLAPRHEQASGEEHKKSKGKKALLLISSSPHWSIFSSGF